MLFGRDLITIAVAALLFSPSAGALTPTPTGTPDFRPTPTGVHVVSGHVAAGPGCDGDRGGVQVSISAGDRAVLTGADGRFEFPDLPYGYYTLRVFPDCPVIPCYGTRGVFVDGSDVEIDICRDHCPAATRLTITSGTPGTLLDLTGRCDAARNAAVMIWFDDRQLATLQADGDGVYHGLLTVPLDSEPGVSHLFRAVLADSEIASAEFRANHGPPPCVGDCNRDGRVTIDELLRGIRAALASTRDETCSRIDASRNGRVSIEELVAAVQLALNGCPLPDLVPLSVRYSRCIEPGCYAADVITHFMEVCVANQGAAESPGFDIYDRSGVAGTAFAPPLPIGETVCVEMPLALAPQIEVDSDFDILEEDDSNNVLEEAIAAPTACDVIPPPCTATPVPTATPPGPTPSPT